MYNVTSSCEYVPGEDDVSQQGRDDVGLRVLRVGAEVAVDLLQNVAHLEVRVRGRQLQLQDQSKHQIPNKHYTAKQLNSS